MIENRYIIYHFRIIFRRHLIKTFKYRFHSSSQGIEPKKSTAKKTILPKMLKLSYNTSAEGGIYSSLKCY